MPSRGSMLRPAVLLRLWLLAAAYHLPMMPPARRAVRVRLQASEPPGYPDEVQLASLVAQWKRDDARTLAESSIRLAGGPANRSLAGSSMQRRPGHAIAVRGSAGANGVPPAGPSKRLQYARDQVHGVVAAGMSTRLPAVQYEPVRAAARFSARPLEVSRRQLALVAPLVSFVGRVVVDLQMGREKTYRPRRAVELTQLLSSLGPAIIKAGQALSSRSDLLPKEYLVELQKLQDQVPPFPDETAFEIMSSELGNLSAIFRSIGPTPVAAASLGQVYRGQLADGRDVAVKVQRPGCEETIALDLHILRAYSSALTSVISLLGREIDLVNVIDDFGNLIYAEIDYSVEAANARRFRELYGNLPNVSAPAVFESLSTSRVMTMEWVYGCRLTDAADGRAAWPIGPGGVEVPPAALVDTLVQCSLRQILDVGFFHADPHAGNLLVTKEGELTYIDFGMMSTLAPEQRYGIIEAVVHIVNRDFMALAALYQRLGFVPAEVDTAPIASALEAALPDVLNASVSQLNFKSVVDKLGDVMYKYRFSLPPFYIAIIRCLGVLEGVALQVDSDFAIIKSAYPFIASRLLTDKSPQLQSALMALIFNDGRLRWDRLEALLSSAAGTSDYDLLDAVEQIADYLLSPAGEPLLAALTDEIVHTLDVLGADSAAYAYALAARVARGTPVADVLAGVAAAAGGAAANGAGGEGAAGPYAPGGAQPLPESVARALRLVELVQRSAQRSPAEELPRLGSLLIAILAQRKAQRQLAEVTLQLAERAAMRTLRWFFDGAERPAPDRRGEGKGS